ncbi:MAG TPA: M48 family metalloprotease [Patescibacteria group bacterium]|nr:M48 family metalloprotease [Patescibacteria group bacterium]
MKDDIKEIIYSFEGKLVGNKRMKNLVSQTLSLMPENIIDKVTKTCWFVSSFEDAWAFTFTGNDLKNQHLIFLSDHLLNEHVYQIRYTIAHEIGHVILGHRNSTLIKQTKEEIRKQEEEADNFAKLYISEY